MFTVDARRLLVGVVTAAASLLVVPTVSAQAVYETVHSFTRSPEGSFGRLLQTSNGHIYGVAAHGGTHLGGAIFQARPDSAGGWTVDTFHAFQASQGVQPLSGLAEGYDGALYGTTSAGGAHGGGTIFRITLDGQFQVLHAFVPALHGYAPLFGPLAYGTDGAFYGTASAGGANQRGTIFRITHAGVFTVLRHFAGPDGASPTGGVIRGRDGAFYGTAFAGGVHGYGTAFRLTPQGSFTRLHSFPGTSGQPLGWLEQTPDGNLFGIVTGYSVRVCGPGFPAECTITSTGSVYRMTTNGVIAGVTGFTNFQPGSGLTLAADGLLYGLGAPHPPQPNSDQLQVLRVDPSGNSPRVLYPSIGGSIGTGGYGGLIAASDGLLYGTTSQYGSLFTVALDAEASVNVLHTLVSEGYHPTGRLALAADGALYGTTNHGGRGWGGACVPTGCGGVFKLDGGIHSELPDLPYGRRSRATGDVRESSSGTLFYARDQSGTEMTKGGEFIRELGFLGGRQFHAPIETSAGVLYGTSTDSLGTTGEIWRYQPGSDQREVVFAFPNNGADGLVPYGALVEGPGGHLYGTTAAGGASGYGTIFRLSVTGQLTTLHHFSRVDGAAPFGTLVEGSDGMLYGTTYDGGPGAAAGVVFRIAPDGSQYAVVHAFSSTDGTRPIAGLTRGPADVLYGTASAGGAGSGSVFAVTASGSFSVLHRFAAGEGTTPLGGVTVMPDGSLYGTTFGGGAGKVGVVYRLAPMPVDRIRR
jgi:uncharacterized repeat protein (TIGR03803 family)